MTSPSELEPDELSAQIRFYLGQMRSRNAHHEFEDLCREWSRIRISRNILPATGPVASGGDQARDFETFRSYLADHLPGSSLAPYIEGHLVFACTLQQDDLGSKIRSDLRTIVTGRGVHAVYYFSEANVTTALRHTVIAWAKSELDLELEVIDGYGLSIQLRDRDTFWVAARYLRLPAQLGPADAVIDADDWYVADRARWRQTETRMTIGDLIDLKICLRRAVFNETFRQDAGFWLGRLGPLTAAPEPGLRHRARAEYIVASFRVNSTMRDIDQLVDEFLEEGIVSDDPTILEDVSVVLGFRYISFFQGGTRSSLTEIKERQAELIDQIEAALTIQDRPGRATLLETLGYALLYRRENDLVLSNEVSITYHPNRALDADGQLRDDLPPPPADLAEHLLEPERVVEAWLELAAGLPELVLFPADELCQMVDWLTPAMHGIDGWSQLVEHLEEYSERVTGSAKVADRCRRRALGLYRTDQPLAAYREFQQARANWFNGKNLRGALLALQLAGACLQQLRLPTAGKYYHLSAAWIAYKSGDDNLLDFVPSALAAAAQCDYESGAWLSSATSYATALVTHREYAEAPELWYAQDHLLDGLRDQMSIEGFVRQHGEAALVADLRAFHLAEGLTELLDSANARGLARDHTEELFESVLTGRPMGDSGTTWFACFSIFGVTFRIECFAEEVTVRAAERFIAYLQISLVSLADFDFCFGAREVDVLVTTSQPVDGNFSLTPGVQSLPSANSQSWEINLLSPYDERSAEQESSTLAQHTFASIATILRYASLRKSDELESAIESALDRGLSSDLRVAPSYDSVSGVVSFPKFHRRFHVSPFVPVVNYSQDLLPANGSGPTYTKERAVELLVSRYAVLEKTTQLTLPRLGQSEKFRETTRNLRRRGWKDWHLLLSIYSIMVSERVNGLDVGREQDAELDRLRRELRRPETEELAVVSEEAFSIDALVQARRGSMLPLLGHWSLVLHHPKPDLLAIENVLSRGYGYWSDDVEHIDPFPWASPATTG